MPYNKDIESDLDGDPTQKQLHQVLYGVLRGYHALNASNWYSSANKNLYYPQV